MPRRHLNGRFYMQITKRETHVRLVLVDALAALDRRFAEIAIAKGYLSRAAYRYMRKALRHGRDGEGHIKTLPNLLFEKGMMSLEEIDSVFEELLDQPGEEFAASRAGDVARERICSGGMCERGGCEDG